MDENALISRIRMLREMEKLHEGYSKAVKLVMGEVQRGDPAPHPRPSGRTAPCAGPLHSGHRDRSGGAMQNLVVDREGGWQGGHPVSEAGGTEAGPPSCPSAPIRPGELREAGSLSREPGFVGVADQLVQFDPQYRAVFSNLLGRVAVMEDLDTAIAAARRYGYRFRIVTLDGQVLNPGGSMTGGSACTAPGFSAGPTSWSG